jgi:cytochrome c
MKTFSLLLGLSLAAAAAPLTVGAQATPDIGHGEGVFNDLCVSCHMKEGGGQGPTLVGVVGRQSAAVPNVLYSKALQDAHLTWTPETLDKFLTDPQALAPGTAMPVAVSDPKDRADLIAYLASSRNKP